MELISAVGKCFEILFCENEPNLCGAYLDAGKYGQYSSSKFNLTQFTFFFAFGSQYDPIFYQDCMKKRIKGFESKK